MYRTILIKVTEPLLCSWGESWIKREHFFSKRKPARENFLMIQGRCRKGKGGEQRERLGDKASGRKQ